MARKSAYSLKLLKGSRMRGPDHGGDLMWWPAAAPSIAMCQSVAVESHMRECRLRRRSTQSVWISPSTSFRSTVYALGVVVFRRKLRRDDVAGFFRVLPPCLIGIEACATAHHWARVLTALGHEVRLMPASYVKPYLRRQKNDPTDAEAICEAVTRPTMRFVQVKSQEQQSLLMLHRVRELLIRQRTMLVNALRGHLAEFGVVTRQRIVIVGTLIAFVEDQDADLLPPLAFAPSSQGMLQRETPVSNGPVYRVQSTPYAALRSGPN